MPNIGRNVDAVEKQIGHAEDVRKMLFLNSRKAFLNCFLMGCGLGLFAKVLDSTDKEAARSTGGVKNGLP